MFYKKLWQKFSDLGVENCVISAFISGSYNLCASLAKN